MCVIEHDSRTKTQRRVYTIIVDILNFQQRHDYFLVWFPRGGEESIVTRTARATVIVYLKPHS